MHVIFGISALVMLGGTIWMLAKDHNREWRKWQLDDRARERWTIEAQLAQALQQCLDDGQLPDLDALDSRFAPKPAAVPQVHVQLASLRDYEALLDLATEVAA